MYMKSNEVVTKCEVNPLWRDLPYLPPGARELCQYDEWYLKKHPQARQWFWADELFVLIRYIIDQDICEDIEQFYLDLLDARVLLPLCRSDPSAPYLGPSIKRRGEP